MKKCQYSFFTNGDKTLGKVEVPRVKMTQGSYESYEKHLVIATSVNYISTKTLALHEYIDGTELTCGEFSRITEQNLAHPGGSIGNWRVEDHSFFKYM